MEFNLDWWSKSNQTIVECDRIEWNIDDMSHKLFLKFYKNDIYETYNKCIIYLS